jgi:hypothetical protein
MQRTKRVTETCVNSVFAESPILGPMPPPEPAGARLIFPAKLSCDGVEVTQAIQNMNHDVPLVARKRTVVRVYLSATASAPIAVQGVLKARRLPNGPWRAVRSLGPVTIDPAENGQLRPKRESESKSLNFLLPESVCQTGLAEVRVVLLHQTGPFALLKVPANARRKVRFHATPPLRVRILGVRFQGGTPPASMSPSALDYTLIQSWLERAYPVASVEWSQAVVDAPQAWPFDASIINTFVRGIRTTDVVGGMDARTHYYGLVSDGGGGFFMRGLASGIPGLPDPSTVASGPTGPNTWGWDVDGSYGDWYTGHEFGHTYGRFHAEFCGAAGGAPYPFVNGQLSNADGAFVGFDTGDPAQGLPMRALPGTVWHDVMTYCVFQWLSSFTYTGIRDRLIQEEALPGGATLPGGRRGRRGVSMSGTGAIHVVAAVNLTRGFGTVRHVTALAGVAPGRELASARSSRRQTRATRGPSLALRLYSRGGRGPLEFPVTFIPDACRDAGDDETGVVDVLLPPARNASRLELMLNGSVVDTFVAGATGSVRDIRQAPRATRRRAAEADEADPVLTWRPGGAARSRAAAGAPGPTYTVQISTDDGRTWQTAGFALREPRVTIDRHLIGEADTVRVRVTATNGFESSSTEKKIKATDL